MNALPDIAVAYLDHPSARFAREVVERLREQGYQALWAGGCVRDLLRGCAPKDYDVATSAEPDQVRQVFGRNRTLPIGAAFGVICVRGPREAEPIEIATFRRDVGYSDGRRPDQVIFSTAEDDAQRRDFTINGLFFDPLAGCVIDYVGGRNDLQEKVIRAIGVPALRFAEDKLRMLRAVRFATTLQFDIDPRTLAAIRSQAEELSVVSGERIGAEMRRVLVHPCRATGLAWLAASALEEQIFPHYAEPILERPDGTPLETWLSSVRRLPEHATLGQVIATIILARLQAADSGCLSATGEAARRVLTEWSLRWKLSNHETESARWLIDNGLLLMHPPAQTWPALQRILIGPWAAELLDLCDAFLIDRPERAECHQQLELARQRLGWPHEQLNPPSLLNGHDLMKSGIPAGPQIGSLLQSIRDAQLMGRVASRDEALAFAQRLLDGRQ